MFGDRRLVATLGVEDLIIVDTDDALLVADRSRSQDVREVVEDLKRANRSEHLSHTRVYRPWGYYESIDAGERFQVKRLMVKPGAALSLQLHRKRAEHWVVVSGRARVTRGEDTLDLEENQSTYIPVGTRHRLENAGKRAAADHRGAVRQLPRRGRHRALRGPLQPPLNDRAGRARPRAGPRAPSPPPAS